MENYLGETRIFIVIVLYNVFCGASPSFLAVRKQGFFPILVDNSTEDLGNREFCEQENCTYIDLCGNKGLSKAYNAALDYFSGKQGVVIWLDDDTQLIDTYFRSLKEAMESENDAQVYLPIVTSLQNGKNILSPCLFGNFRMRRVNYVEQLSKKRISAINSGMAVRLGLYEKYRYDEELFLDCIDHDFMYMCFEKGIKIFIMKNIQIFQDFSGDGGQIRKEILKRYRIFSKDFRTYQKKYSNSRILTEIILFKRLSKILLKG